MIEINSILNKPVKAKIDGHVYSVRRLGTREQLKLAKLQSIVSDGSEDMSNEKLDAFEALVDTLSTCFDDGVGGKKTKELFDTIPLENIQPLIEQVFAGADSK